MLSKVIRVHVRRFHRWAGIIIGVQLLFWIMGGVYFAWMPFKVVKDEDRKSDIVYEPLALSRTVSPVSLSLPAGFSPKAVHLENTPRGVVYRLESMQGEAAVFDAFSGQPLQHLAPEKASELALKQMKSEVAPVTVELLREDSGEYKGPVPVYLVALNDFRQTHLYADPWSGRIIARRNRFWRIYDFLWMMHIMDFKEREEFNNPWLRTLSLGALVLIMSGYGLFFFGKVTKKSKST